MLSDDVYIVYFCVYVSYLEVIARRARRPRRCRIHKGTRGVCESGSWAVRARYGRRPVFKGLNWYSEKTISFGELQENFGKTNDKGTCNQHVTRLKEGSRIELGLSRARAVGR